MREGKGKTADQTAAGRLDRGSGQGAAEIRFMKPDDSQPGRDGVVAQPSERQLVANRERDQGVGGHMPVTGEMRISDCEIECCVR